MPGGPDALAALGALAGIELPEECEPGVTANLALLGEHWRNVEAFPLPETSER